MRMWFDDNDNDNKYLYTECFIMRIWMHCTPTNYGPDEFIGIDTVLDWMLLGVIQH